MSQHSSIVRAMQKPSPVLLVAQCITLVNACPRGVELRNPDAVTLRRPPSTNQSFFARCRCWLFSDAKSTVDGIWIAAVFTHILDCGDDVKSGLAIPPFSAQEQQPLTESIFCEWIR